MTVDRSLEGFFANASQSRPAIREVSLHSGDGGGTSGGMDERVAKLETHMEYARADMAEVKTDLKAVIARLNELPTKTDLNSWRWQWVATAIAIIALTVGGITGGLALIASAS